MIKRTAIAFVMCFVLAAFTGCGLREIVGNREDTAEEESTEQESAEQPESVGEIGIYQQFLHDEVPVYFRETEYLLDYRCDRIEVPAEADTPYKLSDICEMAKMAFDGADPMDNVSDHISYAYIDCGADGVAELALLFHDLVSEDGYYFPELMLVIKAMGDRLEMCYFTTPYYRWITELNVYGVVNFHVNGGTGVYSDELGYIGSDGVYNMAFFEYNDLNSYYFLELPENFPFTIPEDEWIVLKSYSFRSYGQEQSYEEYYMLASLDCTMPGYNYNTENSTVDIDGLSKAVAETTGMKFVSQEEICAMIEAREAELGLTEEIKTGPEIEWIPLEEKFLE